MYINFYFLSFLVIIRLWYFPSILWSDSNEDNEEENDDTSKNETTEVNKRSQKMKSKMSLCFGWRMYIRNDDEESHILATTWTLGSLRLQDKSDIAYRTIQFRLCALTYRSLRGSTPPYLAETLHLTSDVESRCRLRSGYTSTLVILSSRRTTLGDRAFPCGCSTSLELPDGYLSERRRQTRSFDAT